MASHSLYEESKQCQSRQQSAARRALIDKPFENLMRLIAHLFNVKICVCSLNPAESQLGQLISVASNESAIHPIFFCSNSMFYKQNILINDKTKERHFNEDPLVKNWPNMRFYASTPITDFSGKVMGALCIMDPNPREFSEQQRHVLYDFMPLVAYELNRHRWSDLPPRLSRAIARSTTLLQTLPDKVFIIDRELRCIAYHDNHDVTTLQFEEQGKTLAEICPELLVQELLPRINQAFVSSELVVHRHSYTNANQSYETRLKKINEDEVLLFVRNTSEQTITDSEVRRLSEVARQTTNGVIITDDKGLVTWINEAFSKLSGFSLTDMKGNKPGKLLQGKETNPDTVNVMRQALAKQQGFNVDLLNYHKTGKAYWIRISCNPLMDDHGKVEGYIAVQSDITKEIHDAELIRNKDSLLRAVIEVNTIGIWQLNLESDAFLINDHWAEMLGYELTELEPIDRQKWQSLIHPDDLVSSQAEIKKHALGQVPLYEVNIRMLHQSGDWVWVNTRGRISSLSHDGVAATWLLGTNTDINDQVKVESTLQQRSTHMQAIVENMPDGVISIDQHGGILNFNRAAEQIFGYSQVEMIGSNVEHIINTLGNDSVFSADRFINFAANDIQQTECEACHKNGSVIPVDVRLVQIQKLDKLNFILIVKDITHRKKRDHEIHQLAYYDPLTWLPNRRLLLDRLKEVIVHCTRQDCYGALLFIDLDNFKSLNDSAGHDKGDLLLCRVAQRLSKCVRQGDIVSRIGGDEFVVVLENLSRDEHVAAHQVEISAEKIIAQLVLGFDLDGLAYNGSASIGVTLFNNAYYSHDDLLKQADMAMYKAKAAGRNSIYFYNPKMQVEVTKRAEMEQDLHRALLEQQFQLFYQKQVDHKNQMTGVEVLLRWHHPNKGMVSPAEFIPLAEETGLIVPIGEWVLQEACKTLAQWSQDPVKATLSISVNLSVVQFINKIDIVNTVKNALKQTGANPYRLKLEITESLLASNIPGVKAKMQQMKDFGVSFSIDDFGTGYSSLSYLKQLPIDQLKIDQSFVRDIIASPNDEAIAQAVITLAESMHLEVIAEGVETEAQRLLLQGMGCRAYQGYFYGRPCPLADLVF